MSKKHFIKSILEMYGRNPLVFFIYKRRKRACGSSDGMTLPALIDNCNTSSFEIFGAIVEFGSISYSVWCLINVGKTISGGHLRTRVPTDSWGIAVWNAAATEESETDEGCPGMVPPLGNKRIMWERNTSIIFTGQFFGNFKTVVDHNLIIPVWHKRHRRKQTQTKLGLMLLKQTPLYTLYTLE